MRPVLAALLLLAVPARADRLDDVVRAELARRQVPGLSLAIIRDGKVVRAQGYGVVEAGSRLPVTPATRFQAASLSKPVTALAALRMVQQGQLDLDEDVNTRLTSWKVPESGLTARQKVTLRGLLSHTAGLGVHGFPGYPRGAPLPTVVQVLEGVPPANNPAVRVEWEPGGEGHYSGGGYTVLQLLLADVAGKPFEALMQALVLGPAGMSSSSFQQPPAPALATATAGGVTASRVPVEGRWHVYPEQAAAGLWTTPTDLARFALSLQRAVAGDKAAVLSQDLAKAMLTEVSGHRGLGVFLRGEGPTLQFSHGGRNEGFDSTLVAFARGGRGVVVMMNANDDSRMLSRLVEEVARQQRWPGAAGLVPPRPVGPVPALARYAGHYERDGEVWTLAPRDGRLSSFANELPDDDFVPVGPHRFKSADGALGLTFTASTEAFEWTNPVQHGSSVRLAPLADKLPRQTDPDPALTAKVQVALAALASGDRAGSAYAGFSPGAQRDFDRPDVWGRGRLAGLTFLHATDVAGRGVVRHGHPVSRVLLYALQPARSPRFLLAHLTAEGQLAHFDLLDR